MLSEIDVEYLFLALIVFALFLVLFVSRKVFNFNIDKFIVSLFQKIIPGKKKTNLSVGIKKSTGNKSLILLDAGTNKATVVATLRQIMNIDLPTAQSMVDSAPAAILSNVSDKEADINKAALEFAALEFVGAKLEIK